MLTLDGKDLLSVNQMNYLYNTVDRIIEDLSPKALNQLLEGYDNDIDKMLKEILTQAEKALYLGRTLDSESLDYIENVKASMDTTLKIYSLNYFILTMLPNFRMGWRNIEWGNMTQLFPWSCYLCGRGSGKCLSINELVVMYDGSLKPVQDIKVGDQVMGIDNTPRTVLQLHRGRSQMYKVHQTYAKDYYVNEGHLVCTEWDRDKYIDHGSKGKQYIGKETFKEDIPVEDISKRWLYRYNRIYGYRVEGWELKEKNLPIEPYFLGLWLGDGNSRNSTITTIDEEVNSYLKNYAKRIEGIFTRRYDEYHQRELYSNIINPKKIEGKSLNKILRKLNVLNNKHIPDIYMKGSRQQRLELLAGLLDSDGHLENEKRNGGQSFIFCNTNYELMIQIQQLAWSLGFRCNSIRKIQRDLNLNNGKYKIKNNVYYNCNISGNIWNIPCKITRKRAPYKENKLQNSLRSSLKIEPIGEDNYYGFTLDGDHKFLLSDGTVVHNSFQWSYAFVLWRLWSYCKPVPWRQNTIDNQNRKETCYITNNFTLAKVQVKKVREEIETNDLIAEKLNPNGKASIGETGITTETGSLLHVRGKDSMIRGLHVGAVLCDDMPDESSLYSDEQREKLKELLKGTIEPIVEPYGYFLVCGTPYSSAPNELYQVLKADKRFYCFEYPVIFPDGRPLAPDRYTFDQILAKKEELGTIVFNREYLVVPISDSSTIFPYEYLMRSTIGMENIRFATSIDDYPIKLQRVHIGVDFAVSGNIGADYTVYSVWGVDSMKNYYLLTYYRQKGMSHNEQIDKIVQLDRLFRPNKIVCESNGFQSILSALARERGLKNIETFTTTEGNKKDLYTGLPSLSAMFERGQLKCPYAIGETRQAVDLMFGEFSSITFKSDNGKLEAASGHDDVCMSTFISINSLRECEKEVQVGINLI